MTTQELMISAYQDGGEPSDLSPFTVPHDDSTFDITQPGSVRLLRMCNTGLVRVANWKFRTGRMLRLRGMQGKKYWKDLGPITGNVVSATDSTVLIEGLASNVDGQYDGWTVEITAGTGSGQTRTIVGSTASGANIDLNVHADWDTNPDATSDFSVYKNFFTFMSDTSVSPYMAYHIELDPVLSLQDVVRIRDVGTGSDLDKGYQNDLFSQSVRSKGMATQYLSYGNEIWLDVANSAATSYELLYVRNPAKLTAASQVLDIPEQLHEAVKLWVTHNIMRQGQDFDGAYATKRELEDLMDMVRLQGESSGEYDQAGVVVYG